jgi:hypothetical protein
MFDIFDLVFNTYTNNARRSLFNSLNEDYLYHQLLPSTLKKFPDNGGWVESDKTWDLYVNSPKADISFDDETIEVNYTKKNENGTSTVCKVLSYPSNSIPETVSAVKKDDSTIVISVSKAVIDTPKRKKITIE